jgi:F-type H+-transporting ATPase subunit delta
LIREIAAKRYAEAVYLLASQDGKEEAWSSALQALAGLFGDPGVQALLENPRVPLERKLEVVEKGLAGADAPTLNLARLLLRRGRVSLGPQIAQAYQGLLDQARGISHATVTSAVPLAADEMSEVQKSLSEMAGGPVVVKTQVDESILGGLIVRIGDRLIDGSTRSRLQALKSAMGGGARA